MFRVDSGVIKTAPAKSSQSKGESGLQRAAGPPTATGGWLCPRCPLPVRRTACFGVRQTHGTCVWGRGTGRELVRGRRPPSQRGPLRSFVGGVPLASRSLAHISGPSNESKRLVGYENHMAAPRAPARGASGFRGPLGVAPGGSERPISLVAWEPLRQRGRRPVHLSARVCRRRQSPDVAAEDKAGLFPETAETIFGFNEMNPFLGKLRPFSEETRLSQETHSPSLRGGAEVLGEGQRMGSTELAAEASLLGSPQRRPRPQKTPAGPPGPG